MQDSRFLGRGCIILRFRFLTVNFFDIRAIHFLKTGAGELLQTDVPINLLSKKDLLRVWKDSS